MNFAGRALPLTSTGSYKLLTASLTGPQSALPNTAFTLNPKGAITGGTSADVYAYTLYENATWSYTPVHLAKVTSGTVISSKGFNWGSTYQGSHSLSKPAGTYKYTLVLGYRSTAHGWYDLAVDLTIKVAAAPAGHTYTITGKDSPMVSKAGPARYTYVQLAPVNSGAYYGNIKVTYDQADKVECISVEENPTGAGMWTWWTTATADPTKGSTGALYQYSDGGGFWARGWVAQGKGNGTPGSIDPGSGGSGSSGHVYLYTSGSTSSAGFLPLRLGFKLKPGITAPVTVTFQVRSNSLTSYNWHAAALGAPVTNKITITPTALLSATVDCKPDTLKLKGKYQKAWLKCYIELPKTKLAVLRIQPKTVLLNGLVKADPTWGKIGDFDKDGHWDMQVRFNRSVAAALLKPGVQTLTVSGKLWVFPFAGSDTVKVLAAN